MFFYIYWYLSSYRWKDRHTDVELYYIDIYKFLLPACDDETITLSVGDSYTFESPNYPKPYLDDIECTKTVVVSINIIW